MIKYVKIHSKLRSKLVLSKFFMFVVWGFCCVKVCKRCFEKDDPCCFVWQDALWDVVTVVSAEQTRLIGTYQVFLVTTPRPCLFRGISRKQGSDFIIWLRFQKNLTNNAVLLLSAQYFLLRHVDNGCLMSPVIWCSLSQFFMLLNTQGKFIFVQPFCSLPHYIALWHLQTESFHPSAQEQSHNA